MSGRVGGGSGRNLRRGPVFRGCTLV
eukprot:SAG31_NODE_46267_length_255_cov_0.666667_1_plen_25_part_10